MTRLYVKAMKSSVAFPSPWDEWLRYHLSRVVAGPWCSHGMASLREPTFGFQLALKCNGVLRLGGVDFSV